MHHNLSHKGAFYADLWCAEGADEIPPSHIWAYHGWGKQADRSTETVQRLVWSSALNVHAALHIKTRHCDNIK